MFCANCGSPVPNGKQFCPECGCRQLVDSSPAAAPSPSAAPAANPSQPEKSRKKTILMVCVAVGIAALVVLCLVYLLTGGGSSKNTVASDTTEETAVTIMQAESEADEELFGSESSENTAGYDTPEEAAVTMMQAMGETDEELFISCFHPSMVDVYTDALDISNRDVESEINELYVKSTDVYDYYDDGFVDLQKKILQEFGVKVTKAAVVKLFCATYNYSEGERRESDFDVYTIYVDGAWYVYTFTLTGGESSENTAGYDTPEEAAVAFVHAGFEADEELYKSCIHPSMVDELMDTFNPDVEMKVTGVNVKSTDDYNDDDFVDLQEAVLEEYGVKVTKAAVVKLSVTLYDYSEDKERGGDHDVLTIYVDGAWYVLSIAAG